MLMLLKILGLQVARARIVWAWASQLALTCSNSTMETPEQCAESV